MLTTTTLSKIFFFVLLTSCLCSELRRNINKPWFCHDLDCPLYETISNNSRYEIRSYSASKWTSTNVAALSFEDGIEKGFSLLFDYITGQNSEKININMTAPVRVVVQPGQGPFCENNFTVSFYLPYIYQDTTPPRPTNPVVSTESDTTEQYAVLSFGGFATDNIVINQATLLAGYLAQDNITYNQEFFIFGGYDGPDRITNRHNEIWLQIYK
eukprot:TRINITY_DN15621_c0_g1_i1.p1 TRINITY_DN15621_c0_g1~~TRINITY_DN15621_c0_g1_i1.p1  ORF type:complete len:229 (-),score=23.62 TRINITY_DN15621_c0_g1_i1:16-654(-)